MEKRTENLEAYTFCEVHNKRLITSAGVYYFYGICVHIWHLAHQAEVSLTGI